MGLQKKEFSAKTFDDLTLKGSHWLLDQPKAMVVLCHGLGEHVDRYDHMAAAFAKARIGLIGLDHRGHGRSEGKRGHTRIYDAFLEEVSLTIQVINDIHPGVPIFLYGHSMGGNIVLNYGIRNATAALAGIISSAPWIRLPNPPPSALLAFARVVRNIYPGFTQSNGLDVNHLSTDKAVVEAYIKDPLVHDRITAQTAVEMTDAAQRLDDFNGHFSFPLLIIHGGSDQITDSLGSKAFVDRARGDVEYYGFEGMYHEIHNEPGQRAVFEKSISWMESRMG
jgi:alpha-beta hydrolase superfamily lysophospholipase